MSHLDPAPGSAYPKRGISHKIHCRPLPSVRQSIRQQTYLNRYIRITLGTFKENVQLKKSSQSRSNTTQYAPERVPACEFVSAFHSRRVHGRVGFIFESFESGSGRRKVSSSRYGPKARRWPRRAILRSISRWPGPARARALRRCRDASLLNSPPQTVSNKVRLFTSC